MYSDNKGGLLLSLFSIFLTAIGLAMDAFAVSVTIGMCCDSRRKTVNSIKAGMYFGIFQGIMPLIGYFASIKFADMTGMWDKVIAFIILAFLGGKMIYEALHDEDEACLKCYNNKAFITLAVATSIDALAVGVSFAVLDTNIFASCAIIALVTGILSFIGVRLGKFIAGYIGNKAEIAGGIILLLIGFKILFF